MPVQPPTVEEIVDIAEGYSLGTNWKGHYTTSLLDAMGRGLQTRPNDLSETVKLMMLTGRYMQERYHGRYYAKAQNLSRALIPDP